MAYSDFTLQRVRRDFGLTLQQAVNLFAGVSPIPPSDFLRETLAYNVPLTMSSLTEKARSEMIITPILLEARRRLQDSIGLFSGVEFTVDGERGLNGVCDYILSRSLEPLVITAPVVMIVEAKNDNLKAGYGQCLAEMVAAQKFNQQESADARPIFGVVTMGTLWKFLKLEGTLVSIDLPEYHLEALDQVLGALVHICQ